MANKNRTSEKEAFWRLALDEFQGSGLTVRAYCLQEGLSEPSFYAWRRTIKKRDAATEADPTRDEPVLVRVDVVDRLERNSTGQDQASLSPPLEVISPSGFTLRFDQDIEPQKLEGLLYVIAHAGGVAPC